jgi:hypothetical protein
MTTLPTPSRARQARPAPSQPHLAFPDTPRQVRSPSSPYRLVGPPPPDPAPARLPSTSHRRPGHSSTTSRHRPSPLSPRLTSQRFPPRPHPVPTSRPLPPRPPSLPTAHPSSNPRRTAPNPTRPTRAASSRTHPPRLPLPSRDEPSRLPRPCPPTADEPSHYPPGPPCTDNPALCGLAQPVPSPAQPTRPLRLSTPARGQPVPDSPGLAGPNPSRADIPALSHAKPTRVDRPRQSRLLPPRADTPTQRLPKPRRQTTSDRTRTRQARHAGPELHRRAPTRHADNPPHARPTPVLHHPRPTSQPISNHPETTSQPNRRPSAPLPRPDHPSQAHAQSSPTRQPAPCRTSQPDDPRRLHSVPIRPPVPRPASPARLTKPVHDLAYPRRQALPNPALPLRPNPTCHPDAGLHPPCPLRQSASHQGHPASETDMPHRVPPSQPFDMPLHSRSVHSSATTQFPSTLSLADYPARPRSSPRRSDNPTHCQANPTPRRLRAQPNHGPFPRRPKSDIQT